MKLGIVFTEPPPGIDNKLMHNYDNVYIALFSLYRIFTQKVKNYTHKSQKRNIGQFSACVRCSDLFDTAAEQVIIFTGYKF